MRNPEQTISSLTDKQAVTIVTSVNLVWRKGAATIVVAKK
jgi:hypothetical protein